MSDCGDSLYTTINGQDQKGSPTGAKVESGVPVGVSGDARWAALPKQRLPHPLSPLVDHDCETANTPIVECSKWCGMDECVFCQIVTGEEDAYILHETERTAAFLDQNPAVLGHTLVVPKTHQEFLLTDDESLVTDVFGTVRTVALALNEILDPDGVSLFYTSAELVGRVTHAHVHLLPRYANDDIRLALARDSLDDAAATRLAARVQEHL